MSKIYKNQTKLRITRNVGIDLTNGQSFKIKFIKPDNSEGFFNAAKLDSTHIYYDVTQSSDLDQSGVWKFWAFVTFADGTYAAGEPIKKIIYDEGN